MIAYPNFQFAAPPRTGSTWFLFASCYAGLGEGSKTDVHRLFPIQETQFPALRVSLVRHPVSWLNSLYHSIGPGKIGVDSVDRIADLVRSSSSDWESFLESFLKHENLLWNIVQEYGADSLIKTEELESGFISLCDSFEWHLSKETRKHIQRFGPMNTSRRRERSTVTTDQRQRIIGAEPILSERYDYF